MKIKFKLNNPFLLTANGFLAGALIFWATHGEEGRAVALDAKPAAAQSAR